MDGAHHTPRRCTNLPGEQAGRRSTKRSIPTHPTCKWISVARQIVRIHAGRPLDSRVNTSTIHIMSCFLIIRNEYAQYNKEQMSHIKLSQYNSPVNKSCSTLSIDIISIRNIVCNVMSKILIKEATTCNIIPFSLKFGIVGERGA